MNKTSYQSNYLYKYRDHIRMGIILLVAFICMMTFAIVQPFGDGPDEINRYKVVQFIVDHGTLPVGNDPEILLDGYGGSYAFQPILTYIIDGYLIRALSFVLKSFEAQLLLARIINVLMGLLMIIYVRKISQKLFTDSMMSWLFTIAVSFWPENLFLFSYVNTDAMGFLSIAIIIDSILRGMKDNYTRRTSIQLAIGVILCALSYYNCYGIVLVAIICFLLQFYHKFYQNEEKDINTSKYEFRKMISKACFIMIIVLIGISWWFIRNAILYDGDFLGLTARELCAAETSLEQYNPITRDTYQRLGISLKSMVFDTDYYTLVWKSFIAMFGPMTIPTHHYIYVTMQDLFVIAVIGLVTHAILLVFRKVPVIKKIASSYPVMGSYSSVQKWMYNLSMIVAIIIPSGLALYYSYTYDFQPQGRYYLPILIPFMYFLVIGVSRLFNFFKGYARAFWYHIVYGLLVLSLLYSVFVAFLRAYRS